MAGKFAEACTQLSLNLEKLYVQAIREALLAGLEEAIRATKHDSSNAAAHWQLAAKMRSRPQTRRFGKLRDLRGTAVRPAVDPVGKRGDGGKHEERTVKFVRNKELDEVINKYVKGRAPETQFLLYNVLSGESEYGINALIEQAGWAGWEKVREVLDEKISEAKVRIRFR